MAADRFEEARRLLALEARRTKEVAAELQEFATEHGIELELDADAAPEVGSPVLIRPVSENRKLAPVVMDDVGMARKRPRAIGPFCSSTFLPVAQTCPPCPFKGNGCMAESGYTGRPNRRIEANAVGLSATDVVCREAAEIDRLLFPVGVPRIGGRDGKSPMDLRLHVSGDVRTLAGLRVLVEALRRWRARGGGSVWTFTHAWRQLPGEAWDLVSVGASLEDPRDSELARARGYFPAMTVTRFPAARSFKVIGSSTTWIPCPAELGRTTCVECRLCLDRGEWLRETDRGIAFAVHGSSPEKARGRLPSLRVVK